METWRHEDLAYTQSCGILQLLFQKWHISFKDKPKSNCETLKMFSYRLGIGVLKFSKGNRMGSMAKASFRDANGLGGHGRDLGIALYFTGGPRRLYG